MKILLFCTGLLLTIAVLAQSTSCAEMAKEGNHLMVRDSLYFALKDTSTAERRKARFLALRGSDFKIIEINAAGVCFVEFRGNSRVKAPSKPVRKGHVYTISSSEITPRNCEFSQGLYVSAVTLPFKYRFARGGTPSKLSSNLNVGTTLGLRLGEFGIVWTISGFLGLENIGISDVNSSEVENKLGLTYGGGVVFALTPNTQVGFFVGSDHLSGSAGSDWEYQDHIWYSIGLGFKFLDI